MPEAGGEEAQALKSISARTQVRWRRWPKKGEHRPDLRRSYIAHAIAKSVRPRVSTKSSSSRRAADRGTKIADATM